MFEYSTIQLKIINNNGHIFIQMSSSLFHTPLNFISISSLRRFLSCFLLKIHRVQKTNKKELWVALYINYKHTLCKYLEVSSCMCVLARLWFILLQKNKNLPSISFLWWMSCWKFHDYELHLLLSIICSFVIVITIILF